MKPHIGFTEEQDAAVEAVTRRALRCGMPPNVSADDVRQVARLAIWRRSDTGAFEAASNAVAVFLRGERRWATRNLEITEEMEREMKDEPVVCIDVGPYLDLLNFDEGLAVELRCIEGWAYAEIALALGVPDGTARNLVSDGLARIKKMPR